MPYEYYIKRRVEFSDTDMAGIVHFARFFVFMEAAEHAFYVRWGRALRPNGRATGSGAQADGVLRISESGPV